MSDASVRGRSFEIRVQKLTARILKLEIKRDPKSGAGLHKQDVRARFINTLPLFIECKDQEKLNVKKEWRIADGKASYGQAPVVVFPDNEEILCVIRYSDVLQFVKEAADWKDAADYLSKQNGDFGVVKIEGAIEEAVEVKKKEGASTCRAGHIADQYGYCMQKNCQYSRGYKAKKTKK